MKEKNAFGGWFFAWVLGSMGVCFARVGKLDKAMVCMSFAVDNYWENEEELHPMDGGGPGVYTKADELWSGLFPKDYIVNVDGYEETMRDWDFCLSHEFFGCAIALLDEVYNMGGVDINFKNTLIVVRKEWMTKVE